MAGRSQRGTGRADVLAVLVREADLDGIVIVPSSEVGEQLGLDAHTVRYHIENLKMDGALTIIGQTEVQGPGVPRINIIQLDDSVLD